MSILSAIGSSVQTFGTFRLRAVVLMAGLSTIGIGGKAHADHIVQGQSDGFAISSNLTINPLGIPLVTATINPVNENSGISPTTYGSTNTLNQLNASAGTFLTSTLLTANSGIMTSTATSNIGTGATTGSASSSETISNLDLNILPPILGNSLLEVSATTLTSAANSTGTYGSLGSTGSAGITNLAIHVGGLALVIPTIAPNVTVSTGLVGLTIGLDVQTPTGNGVSGSGMITQDIVITFNNVASGVGLSVINGSVIIGQSESQVTTSLVTVPEPSTMAMTIFGLALTGLVGSRACRKTA